MRNLDLTDVENNLPSPFENFYRIGNYYIASKIDNDEQVKFLKDLGVKFAVDMKTTGEVLYPEASKLQENGIGYYHFPVSDLDLISFEALEELDSKLSENEGKILIYCMSGNRVGAVMGLLFSQILGHPKNRSVETACKIGLTKEGLKDKLVQRLSN